MSIQIKGHQNCCSQCHQVGHNKRNRECPVNVRMREQEEEVHESMRQSLTDLTKAEEANSMLTRLFQRWEGILSIEECVASSMVMVEHACRHTRSALKHYNVDGLRRKIVENVLSLNRVLQRHQSVNPDAIYTLGMVFLNADMIPRYFPSRNYMAIGLSRPIADIPQNVDRVREYMKPHPSLKPSNGYLKVLSIEVKPDLSVSGCECPVCFESLEASNVVQTSCGHIYCAGCIKSIATSIKDKTTPPRCPMCRAVMTELKTGKQEICAEIKTHLSRL
jgi:zinc-RING finger domain